MKKSWEVATFNAWHDKMLPQAPMCAWQQYAMVKAGFSM
jgi:hypothetical protein